LKPFLLSSLTCLRFVNNFLRWAMSDSSSRITRSLHRDIDIILWLLFQRNDLARSSPSTPA
jgi:hypothetical protein